MLETKKGLLKVQFAQSIECVFSLALNKNGLF